MFEWGVWNVPGISLNERVWDEAGEGVHGVVQRRVAQPVWSEDYEPRLVLVGVVRGGGETAPRELVLLFHVLLYVLKGAWDA